MQIDPFYGEAGPEKGAKREAKLIDHGLSWRAIRDSKCLSQGSVCLYVQGDHIYLLPSLRREEDLDDVWQSSSGSRVNEIQQQERGAQGGFFPLKQYFLSAMTK